MAYIDESIMRKTCTSQKRRNRFSFVEREQLQNRSDWEKHCDLVNVCYVGITNADMDHGTAVAEISKYVQWN